jgi:hypothetical protein
LGFGHFQIAEEVLESGQFMKFVEQGDTNDYTVEKFAAKHIKAAAGVFEFAAEFIVRFVVVCGMTNW